MKNEINELHDRANAHEKFVHVRASMIFARGSTSCCVRVICVSYCTLSMDGLR